jgi:8-oxo-dGTP pyrophosphatase MutT (NUDIX family)
LVEKFVPTIGVFAGILNKEGELLLRRRTLPEEKKSEIAGKTVERDWELPGGIVEQEEMLFAVNEQGLIVALKREVKEELGLKIKLSLPLETFPVVLAKEISGRIVNDIALLIIVKPEQWEGEPKGEIEWVSALRLNHIAKYGLYGGKLVSGWGKRMHRMALIALTRSPNEDSRRRAKETLKEIYSTQ